MLTSDQAVEYLTYVQTAICCLDAVDFDGLEESFALHALFRAVTETSPDGDGPDRLAEMRTVVAAARQFARAVDDVRLARIQTGAAT